jgi:hypothetical protein
MSQHPNAAQLFNTFINLLKELEPFADTRNLKLAFDSERKVYLIGSDFQEPLQSNLNVWREVKAEMRDIIARRCPRIPPEAISTDNPFPKIQD